jgi:hypothetical protein
VESTREEFPIGDTLADGALVVTEHLLGSGSQLLYLGAAANRPDERHLVSVIWAPKGIADAAKLREQLGYNAPGIHDLVHLGHFDVRGDDELRRIHQGQYWALVERLPGGDGDWLPRLLAAPLGPARAVALGLSVGRILERAAAAGHLIVGVRPDYVWARREGEDIVATGLTGRNWDFFAHTGGGCMVPGMIFERHYYAPEVYAERGESDQSLVFTLAVMIAEWATGNYPFPDSWAGGNMHSLRQGRHAPLELPSPLADFLALALKPEPAHRPSLEYFLRRLGKLTAAQLAG